MITLCEKCYRPDEDAEFHGGPNMVPIRPCDGCGVQGTSETDGPVTHTYLTDPREVTK
jgi:hypothetical protein